jgi:hypothetical protein
MRNESDLRLGFDDVLIWPARLVGPSRACITLNEPATPQDSPAPRYVAAEDLQAGSDDINQMISEGSPTR